MSAASAGVPFREACKFWLKLGFVSFGGPAGQIAIMHRELVQARRWISERRFLHALNYCMVLPGPEAMQLATYIGWLMHGLRGAIVAGTFFVLPSLAMLIALSWIYLRFGDQPVIAALLYGMKPAVVAIVFDAAWRIGSRTLHSATLWGVAIAAFVALFAFHLPFPFVILAAALIGFVGARVAPGSFRFPTHARGSSGEHLPAVIGDDSPTPAHAIYSKGRLLGLVVAGLVLWAGALAGLAALFGWKGDFTQMGWFFTKAAMVTFGGAYAVLPYVLQGAVEQHGWLTATQMIDGLALGETTPGPLIMVVAFVGFVGGWTKALLGPEALFAAGVIGALVAAWFTFLPSFLFILAGGPLVERTRGDAKLAAPLTAITAAVVGVIVNLAFFFALQVLWPKGLVAGNFDAAAAVIAAVALVALFRFKAGVIPVIAASAVAGLAVSWLRA